MEIVYKNVREYIKNTRARIQKLNNQNKLRNICSVINHLSAFSRPASIAVWSFESSSAN